MSLSYSELARMALGFVLEDESWPVFVAWVRENGVSAEAHDWVSGGPDLAAVRRMWVLATPDASQ